MQAAVSGCEQLLIATLNMPSRWDMAESVLKTIRGWGVDTDDPHVVARVLMSFHRDERAPDYWDD